eukprot:Nk52_evm28s356 gene=Nk52_evmTU28s356
MDLTITSMKDIIVGRPSLASSMPVAEEIANKDVVLEGPNDDDNDDMDLTVTSVKDIIVGGRLSIAPDEEKLMAQAEIHGQGTRNMTSSFASNSINNMDDDDMDITETLPSAITTHNMPVSKEASTPTPPPNVISGDEDDMTITTNLSKIICENELNESVKKTTSILNTPTCDEKSAMTDQLPTSASSKNILSSKADMIKRRLSKLNDTPKRAAQSVSLDFLENPSSIKKKKVEEDDRKTPTSERSISPAENEPSIVNASKATSEVPDASSEKSANVTTAAVSEKNMIDFAEFLYLANVRFLDNLSSKRRTTMLTASKPISLDNTLNRILLNSIMTPELEMFQWACETLVDTTQLLKESICMIENEMNANNPSVFSGLKNGNSETKSVLEQQLRTVKNYGRLQAKMKWYEWRVKLETAIHSCLEEERSYLSADEAKLSHKLEKMTLKKSEVQDVVSKLSVELEKVQKVLLTPKKQEQLIEFQTDINAQNNMIKTFMHDISELEKKKVTYTESVDELEVSKAKYAKELERAEAVLPALNQELSADVVFERQHIFELAKGISSAFWECTHLESKKAFFAFKDFNRQLNVLLNGPLVEDVQIAILSESHKMDNLANGLLQTVNFNDTFKICQGKPLIKLLDAVSAQFGCLTNILNEFKRISLSNDIALNEKGCQEQTISISVKFISSAQKQKFFVDLDINVHLYPLEEDSFQCTFRKCFGDFFTGEDLSSIVKQYRGKYNCVLNLCETINKALGE